MIRYNTEMLNDEVVAEVEALTKEYYAKTEAQEDLPPLDYNWPVFYGLQQAGMLVMTTARDNDKLVGFTWYIMSPMLHHKTVKAAEADALVVDMHYRGKGIGKALYFYTEEILRALGVQYVVNHFRTCYTAEPIFPKLGFSLRGYAYGKRL